MFCTLDQINNPDDPETRDAWWTELRKEIRSHKKTLGCNAVLGYTETAYINDEICILSACGTAALLKTSETDFEAMCNYYHNSNYGSTLDRKDVLDTSIRNYCHLCHIPYQESQVPFPTNLMTCAICHNAKVPDILFMTITCDSVPITGYGTLIQAILSY